LQAYWNSAANKDERHLDFAVGRIKGTNMVQFKVGSTTITLIPEMIDRSFKFRSFFPKSTDEDIAAHLHWMSPGHYDAGTGRLLLSMHSWLIDTGKHKILVDGCVGNDKTRPTRPDWCNLDTPFLARLHAAGAHPEDIDFVLCTHLHADHVGWNTRLVDGRWIPTFPNAKYVFSRREHTYWEERLAGDNGSGHHLLSYQDSVLPVIQAKQALIVDDYHEIAGCLILAPAPGHTPGHVAIWLQSNDEAGVFTGDILHHPIQLIHPSWSCFGCQDQEEASVTRRHVLEQCADRNALLLPGHFMAPHATYIKENTSGFFITANRPDADK
jgi:glyoxylase-like metal-dependent hydrolase (beta-lactamase superfamily II)